ncbi:MAG: LysM peptidoglycan-binding domain-containing protein [Verrucomicrobiaceae bacterium]|nr:MAG: LysM peptidoglycan-binding domain-containing protein [Verrucomicrobiaceae bacterium]
MKSVLWIPASCALVLTLSSCGNSGGGSGGPGAMTGPFDSRGNYVEEWADNPSKWRKNGGSRSPHESQSDELPEIALNDQPPSNSVPLAPSNTNKPTQTISQTRVTQESKPTSSSSSSSRTRTAASTALNTTKPKTTTSTTTSKPKPKPKPVLVKAKPKPKPKSTRYVVKKGDSLSAIASRTGASVSSIKSANGISGTLIRPGQSLTIPKR